MHHRHWLWLMTTAQHTLSTQICVSSFPRTVTIVTPYFPKRISASANSSNAFLKLASSKTVGFGVYVNRLRNQCRHDRTWSWYLLRLGVVLRLIIKDMDRSVWTYCISVRRICHGGNPCSSSGVRLYCMGLMGWMTIKSGDDNPASPSGVQISWERPRAHVKITNSPITNLRCQLSPPSSPFSFAVPFFSVFAYDRSKVIAPRSQSPFSMILKKADTSWRACYLEIHN